MALDANYLLAQNNRLKEEIEELESLVNALSVIKDPEERTLIPWDKVKADFEIKDLKRQRRVLVQENQRLRMQ